jgi:hypothetical protein
MGEPDNFDEQGHWSGSDEPAAATPAAASSVEDEDQGSWSSSPVVGALLAAESKERDSDADQGWSDSDVSAQRERNALSTPVALVSPASLEELLNAPETPAPVYDGRKRGRKVSLLSLLSVDRPATPRSVASSRSVVVRSLSSQLALVAGSPADLATGGTDDSPLQRCMHYMWQLQAACADLDKMATDMDVDYKRVADLLQESAEIMMRQHGQSFEAMLLQCKHLRDTSSLKPFAFVLKRKYDETPLPLEYACPGDEKTELQQGKLMLVEAEFGVLLRSDTDERQQLFIRGCFPTQLRAMDANTGRLIIAVIQDTTDVSELVRDLFPHLTIFVNTDDYPATTFAENGSRPTITSGHCFVIRV